MVKRLPSIKVRIVDLLQGEYSPGSREDMSPSFVVTSFGDKVSRVSLVATVTDSFASEDENYAAITVDDGTEEIRLKAFSEDTNILNVEQGNLIHAIGKVKEYNGEIYINAEVAKVVKDANYESWHKLKLLQRLAESKQRADQLRQLSEEMEKDELLKHAKSEFGMEPQQVEVILKKRPIDYKPKVLELIESLDAGEGVEIRKLFEVTDLQEHILESTVNELLTEGYIYEPTAGVIRRVSG